MSCEPVQESSVDASQKDAENVSIEILNDDCMTYIFQLLPITDRIRIEKVCQRWRDVSNGSWYSTKALTLPSSDCSRSRINSSNLEIFNLHHILKRCGRFLTDITIYRVPLLLEDDALMIIKQLCPKLKSLTLKEMKLSRHEASKMVEKLENLKTVNGLHVCHHTLKIFKRYNRRYRCATPFTWDCIYRFKDPNEAQ